MSHPVQYVHELMTRHPATMSVGDDLAVASDIIRLGRIRHLPVVDDAGQVVGMLSDRDLACGALFRACGIDSAMERRILKRIEVAEVMAKRVISTTPHTPLSEAASQLNRRKVSCLPVIENEIVVGVLTERDFVIALVDPHAKTEPEAEEVTQEACSWEALEKTCDHLRMIRDELRVQLHLAAMEAREAFEDAEDRWGDLELHLKELRRSEDEPVEETARVCRNFAKEMRVLYDDLQAKIEDS